jgi:hypothetical protein
LGAKGGKGAKRRFGDNTCFLFSATHGLVLPYHGRLLCARAGASLAMMASMHVSVSVATEPFGASGGGGAAATPPARRRRGSRGASASEGGEFSFIYRYI